MVYWLNRPKKYKSNLFSALGCKNRARVTVKMLWKYAFKIINLFYFFIVLIKLYEDQAEAGNRDYLEKLYFEIRNAISPDFQMQNVFSKHFLRTLALIRLALILNKTEEVKAMCNFPSIKSFTELTTDEGIPPDWAFTILDYVFAIHCRLIKFDAGAAYSLRNFLFKNFAFKLRGCKRVCVMATLFAGLRYDVELKGNSRTQDIINIGEYVLTKFVTEKYLAANIDTHQFQELRVYVCFVCLFMADLYKRSPFNAASLLKAAKVHSSTYAGNISEFNRTVIMTIECGRFTKRSEKQNGILLDKSNCERWKAAIVFPRIFDNNGQTLYAARWADLITSLLEKRDYYEHIFWEKRASENR